jgi:curved DNA-binding protein CbpA
MSQLQSHYEILGVGRTATAQEIRAAYLRLMKRYHPDAAPRDGQHANYAPLLNRCYAVLRDPVKRSQYDRQLLRLTSEPAKIPVPRRERTKRSRRWWPVAALTSGAIAATALMMLSRGSALEQGSRALAARVQDWVLDISPPSTVPVPVPLPGGSETRRMAALGRTLNTSDAEHFSRACFAGRDRPQMDPGYADSCVLFDFAFLYWRKTPLSSTLPVYFADETVSSRHRDAMIESGAAADQRLANLRQMAFLALMHDLERTRSAPTGVEPVPVEDPTEMLEGERQRLAGIASQADSPNSGTERSGLRSRSR